MAQTATTGTARATLPVPSVASNVRAELARRRGSGRDLGTALGWSERTTRRRLAGVTAFTVDELTAVAKYLEVSAADLLPPST